MIYLRTGGNGSGKTLLTLKDVRALQLETGRPVCINIRPATDKDNPNKPYCNLNPEVIADFGWTPFRFPDWQAQADGTIFLIDECHYDLPLRAGSASPPPYIQRLTEHRSRGFDFFLLTQHPSNFDGFVRKLVQAPGWHQHIKRLGGALPVANVIQWDAVNTNCEKAGSGKSGEVSTRPYPTEVYKWYKSAVLHTGKKRIPKMVYVLGACVVLVPLLFWLAVGSLTKKEDAPAKTGAATVFAAGQGMSQPGAKVMTASEYVASYEPRVPGLALTAPRYDAVQQVTQAPKPAACIDGVRPGTGVRSCLCWTQQATALPVPEDLCRQIAKGGYFDDTLPVQQQGQQMPPQPLARAQPISTQPDGVTQLASTGYGLRDSGRIAQRNAETLSIAEKDAQKSKTRD